MTKANTVEELHNRAHRAALHAGRDGWWDGSLETGIAAAAGALHQPGANRRIGEEALRGLRGWLGAGDARAIGEDAAALALAAFAAEKLGDGAKRFREEALRTTKQVLSESKAPLAALHLTLIAWAFRRIIRVSNEPPWPDILEAFDRVPRLGIDSLLIGYGKLLVAKEPDPREVARVLQNIPDVDPSEYATLLWALWSGSELLATLLEDEDDDLRVVRKRRAEVFDAVSVEVRDEAMMVESAEEYEPFQDDVQPSYVPHPPDTFEMLMIDLALSRDITGEPLRNPTEVAIVVDRKRNGALLALAGVTELLAAVSAALAVAVAELHFHARFVVDLGVAMVAVALITFVALRVWNIVKKSRLPRRSLLQANVALLVLGAAILVNCTHNKPIVDLGPFLTTAIGLGGPIVFTLLLALFSRLVEGRKS